MSGRFPCRAGSHVGPALMSGRFSCRAGTHDGPAHTSGRLMSGGLMSGRLSCLAGSCLAVWPDMSRLISGGSCRVGSWPDLPLHEPANVGSDHVGPVPPCQQNRGDYGPDGAAGGLHCRSNALASGLRDHATMRERADASVRCTGVGNKLCCRRGTGRLFSRGNGGDACRFTPAVLDWGNSSVSWS
jgi:hypothetical protein